jgi:DnaJ-class molecular chaperone
LAGNISSSIRERSDNGGKEKVSIRPPEKESMMGIEVEANRLVGDNDDCPHCNGMGKLDVPGAPDCPHCKGTGVRELFLPVYPGNEGKIIGKSQNLG